MRPIRNTIFVCIVASYFLVAGCGDGVHIPTPPLTQLADSAPSWSPDGQWIAYVHFNPDAQDTTEPSGLYVIGSSGSGRLLVYQGDLRSVDWSPNSRSLVFNDGFGLHLITAAGESLRTIYSGGGSYPSWSPDGTEIAFSTSSSVFAIRPDGTGLRTVTPPSLTAVDPDWSPAGDRIVVLGNQGSVGEEVFALRPPDTTSIKLTSDDHEDRSPAWSPRGDRIAWNAWPLNVQRKVHPEIWVMDTLGAGKRFVVSAEAAPSWDPSGDSLVFSNQTSNGIRLFVINVDRTGLRQLTR